MGFFSFLSKLFRSSKDDSKLDTDQMNNSRQDYQNSNEDLDDLDFDEMNDVWDELDDM